MEGVQFPSRILIFNNSVSATLHVQIFGFEYTEMVAPFYVFAHCYLQCTTVVGIRVQTLHYG